MRLSLLSTHPKGYAKGCGALAGSTDGAIELERLGMPTLIVTGDKDKISPPEMVGKWQGRMRDAEVRIVKDVEHCHVYEDVEGVVSAIGNFL